MSNPHCRIEDIDVIAPNFKRRLSGVTSTIIQLVPEQAKAGIRIATLGPGLPDHLPFVRFRDLWRLWKRPEGKAFRVWHARRNVEMIAGIVLRDVLRMPLKLVFTSDAQRKHRAFTQFLMRQMDQIVACSKGGASFLQAPYIMVPHGVDVKRFVPTPDKALLRNQIDLQRDHYYVGCFGRVRHQKGTDLFVDAMIALLPKHPGWVALVCGRVTAEHAQFGAELKARVEDAGLTKRILFLGEVPDILPYYQAIDLFVAPSRNEGFGLTPLEAMACGVPVVTSDSGAYEDMVVPGLNGEICQAGDGVALNQALANMMAGHGRLNVKAAAALKFVREHFALDGEVEGLQSIYYSLLQIPEHAGSGTKP